MPSDPMPGPMPKLTKELTLGGVIGEPATRGLLEQGDTIGREHELRPNRGAPLGPPPTWHQS